MKTFKVNYYLSPFVRPLPEAKTNLKQLFCLFIGQKSNGANYNLINKTGYFH
jgi:hypothetical protein